MPDPLPFFAEPLLREVHVKNACSGKVHCAILCLLLIGFCFLGLPMLFSHSQATSVDRAAQAWPFLERRRATVRRWSRAPARRLSLSQRGGRRLQRRRVVGVGTGEGPFQGCAGRPTNDVAQSRRADTVEAKMPSRRISRPPDGISSMSFLWGGEEPPPKRKNTSETRPSSFSVPEEEQRHPPEDRAEAQLPTSSPRQNLQPSGNKHSSPGGISTISLAWDPPVPQPRTRMQTSGSSVGDLWRTSSSIHVSGHCENAGGALCDKPATRTRRPPGGVSSLSLSWGTRSAESSRQEPKSLPGRNSGQQPQPRDEDHLRQQEREPFTTLEILQPDDFHHNLRDEPFLAHTVPLAARNFARCLVMPNLASPVTTTADALAYRERILKRVPSSMSPHSFDPLMTLFMTDNTSSREIMLAKNSGVVYGVVLYPVSAAVTSDFGVTDYAKIDPALEKMEQLGLILLVHGETTSKEVDVFEREQHFYGTVMPRLLEKYPRLKVVCEHISSAIAASFVESAGPNVAATITPHHLFFNRNAMFSAGVNPHLYCTPLLKTELDRVKLLEVATSGSPKFFLGTDSAPYAHNLKERSSSSASCFTAHAALELVAEAFEAVGKLDALEGFASLHGAAFYGLRRASGKRLLVKKAWRVSDTYPFGLSTVVPVRAGAELPWRLLERSCG
eukprot:gnl/TRDRNA2_/TRDRNA2_87906_c0_seq1.p1 gnl/TRDRNA2_/TRDRNA2_87906_c0~~gnl/TRDRNA2_/TRDRNA2_87906_c0_seq1.p1  ORF type:complete len:673 (-),score=81.06 gnl/TRDRNA2_/TRDRNA2_87906_c0_seq1:248-2266(-)